MPLQLRQMLLIVFLAAEAALIAADLHAKRSKDRVRIPAEQPPFRPAAAGTGIAVSCLGLGLGLAYVRYLAAQLLVLKVQIAHGGLKHGRLLARRVALLREPRDRRVGLHQALSDQVEFAEDRRALTIAERGHQAAQRAIEVVHRGER